MLFRIDDSSVFLCGTIHVLPREYILPQSLFDRICLSEACMFESEFTVDPSLLRYPAGQTIADYIPAELFSATVSLCESLGLPSDELNKKPWALAITIGSRLLQNSGIALGPSVDVQLWNAAVGAGKTPSLLEDAGDTLRIFDAAPLSEQITGLEFLISNPNRAIDRFNWLYTAWRVWDAGALESFLDTSLNLSPITYGALINGRNRKWLPVILEALNSGRRTFFAVGALHLCGDNGLQRLLEDHGHIVTPA